MCVVRARDGALAGRRAARQESTAALRRERREPLRVGGGPEHRLGVQTARALPGDPGGARLVRVPRRPALRVRLPRRARSRRRRGRRLPQLLLVPLCALPERQLRAPPSAQHCAQLLRGALRTGRRGPRAPRTGQRRAARHRLE